MTLIALDAERLCARCGYDLRALAEHRCPECGLPFDPDAPPPPAVPWLRRREIGLLRGYFATTAMVVLRPRTFAEQAWRWGQIDPAQAESFRRCTVLLATFCFTLGLLVADIILRQGRIRVENEVASLLLLLPTLTFLWIATLRVPVPMPYARRSGVEKRFAYLQKFCCAGLGSMPAFVLVAGVSAIGSRIWMLNPDGVYLVMFLALVAVVIAWISGCATYLIFGGRVNLGMALMLITVSAGLWILAFTAAFLVGLAETAVFFLFSP